MFVCIFASMSHSFFVFLTLFFSPRFGSTYETVWFYFHFSEWSDNFLLTEVAFDLLGQAGLEDSEQSILAQANVTGVLGLMWSLYSEPEDMKYFTDKFVEYGWRNPDSFEVQNVFPILQQVLK
jgi:hypothetical protein